MIIERNHVVSFHYSFSAHDGAEVESSRDGEPVAVLQGHGNVVRGVKAHCNYPVFVIDDASTDNTRSEAETAGDTLEAPLDNQG